MSSRRAERVFLIYAAPNVGISGIVGHTVFLGVAEVGHKGRDEGQWAEDPEAGAVPRLKPVGLVDHGVALDRKHPIEGNRRTRTGYSNSLLTPQC